VYKFAVLYLLILIAVFFGPDFLGSAGNIILKLFLLAGVSYLLYDLWREQEKDTQHTADEQTSSAVLSANSPEQQDSSQTLFENDSIPFSRLLDEYPHYKECLQKQFALIRDFILPHNGYLIHLDANNRAYLLQKETKVDIQGPFDFSESQIFTLVEAKKQFLVENNLEPETNLLPFYRALDYRPASCLAFSTHLPSGDRLYWIFDAAGAEFFNDNDFSTLKRINDNTLQLLQTGMQNRILEKRLGQEQLNFDLAQKLNRAVSLEDGIELFTQFIVDKFEASKLTVALRTSDREAVIQKAIGIEDPFKEGYSFPLDEGLNGWVIMKNNSYLIDNIDKGEYFIPRFSRSEKTNYGLCSFLSTPISLAGEALGMVTLEDKKDNKYNDEDKNCLTRYCAILAQAVGRFQNATQGERNG